MRYKISVIVPVYMVEKYIRRCVDSILAQSYKNIEVILVDDGSQDNCAAICDEYAANDARVVVIHKENEGLSMARNCGISVSTGDYIAFVDSDDFIATDMLESMLERMIHDGSDLAICNFLYVDENGREIAEKNVFSPIRDEKLRKEELISKLGEAYRWYYVPAWNRLYSRVLINDTFFPQGKMHEDEYVVHHLFERCVNVSCLQKPLYMYVQRTNSIMRASFSVRKLDGVEAFCDRVLFAKTNGYQMVEGAAFRSARRMLLRAYIELDKRAWKDETRCREIKRLFKRMCISVLTDKIPLTEKLRGLGMVLVPRLIAVWGTELRG